MRTFVCFILLGVMCGCSSQRSQSSEPEWTSQSGDFGSFLSKDVRTYTGGAVTNLGPASRFQAKWTSKCDTNCIQVFMDDRYRAGVEACMRQLFGTPTEDQGFPRLLYKTSGGGVSLYAMIQFDPIYIVVDRSGHFGRKKPPTGDEKQKQ